MKKIIIIGGGIAGLSAGCYARMNGYETHIYEMHNLPGGLCTCWKKGGYTSDLCIHWLQGTSPNSDFHKIWQELGALDGKKIYYKEMTSKLFLKDQTINFYNDPDRLASYFKEIAPEDSDAIDEFADSLRMSYQMSDMPLTKPKELFTVIDKIKMIKSFIPFIKFFKKYGEITIDEFANKFQNPILQRAIKALKVENPMDIFFSVLFLLANKDNGAPEGGSLNLAKRIEQRYISLGGKIHYRTKVSKILVEKNNAVGIQLEDGKEVKADIVISAADGYSTIFKMLDGKFTNKKIRNLYENEPVFPSHLRVTIGVNMDLSADPNLNNSIYYIHELDSPIIIDGEKKQFMYLQNYAYDPTFAPSGKSILVVSFMSKYDYWEELYQDKEKYVQEKKHVEKIVISTLEKILPGIKEKIEIVDVSTPITINRYTNNRKGVYMGFLNVFLNISKTLPKLKNFFMVGQWVGGVGVSGAAQSGRECMEIICSKDKKSFITTTA
jgi:phytoene dehydrogenase-like protein